MQRSPTHTLLTLAVATAVAGAPILASADDIDIFTGASGGKAANPRVLMVLDNTSNWSRQSQKWPDGATQGQSETSAIRKVIADLDDSVNVGLMEFVTGGNANDNGGYIRQAIGALDASTKAAFTTKLNTIYGNITSPDEKRNSNTPYGNLMYDVYNYFSGGMSYSPSAVISTLGDTAGYTSAFTRFKAPIGTESTCGKTFMIFISNPNASGPSSDDADNTARLNALNGSPVTQLGLANFTVKPTTKTDQLGTTAACYSSPTAAAVELPSFSSACSAYSEGCAIGTETAPAAPIACAPGSLSYTVVQSVYTPPSTNVVAGTPVVGTTSSSSASSTGYYASASEVPSTDHGTLTCPSSSTVTSGGNSATTTYSCSYAVGAAIGTATTTTSTATTSQSGNTGGAGCYTGVGTAAGNWNPASTTDYGGLSCPANSSCTYSGVLSGSQNGCTPASGSRLVNLTQTAVTKRKYTITQTVTPTTVNTTTTTIPASTATKELGKTSQCYASAPGSTTDYASSCTGTNISCTYNNSPTSDTLASCPAGTNAYQVVGNDIVLVDTPTGTTFADTGPRNADEWARMMHDKGIPVDGSTIRPSVITYTIDVYNAQPNATHTALMMSMAKAGGGKYFAAKNEQQIVDALKQIMLEIQSVNTAFASTSLPVNATNRSQNENQVFIGMFRPDPHAKPRWFGNLKRYQLIPNGATVELGDSIGASAVNTVKGFITPCALSYWTKDSGSYWNIAGLDPVPKGSCNTSTYASYDPFSDAPDGPLVEKGAVAQMLRQGNTSDISNHTLNRKVLTVSGGAFTDFNASSSGLSEDLVNFIRGQDVNDERGLGKTSETRPSIHGDVIHSRPQPVNYGDKGVTVYYGANDGTLHAVNANNGTERWAFVAPEFFSRLARMKDNSPLVSYPNMSTTGISPAPTGKDYYFDGSIGLYQNRANTKVMIYPTMRRGGRMIYGIDVTDPDAPKYVWKAGCPNLLNDTGCSTGMEGIGQTWSMPNVAYLKGYSTTVPVIVVGGGYDSCEDADSTSPSCGAGKGGHIYVLNAFTGALIRDFTTSRAVAADVSLIDVNHDGFPDYAYAADTGGNLYRVDFVDGPSTLVGLASSAWTSRTVAYTAGGGRKFLFTPALLGNQTKVYLAIGTGDREHPLEKQYPYTQVVNRFYVYMDDLTRGLASPAIDLDKLLDYTSNTTCDTPSVYPDSGLTGWFMNLNQYGQGEQVVTAALIAGGMVTFSTNRPLPEVTGTCSSTLGEAGGYWVNLFNASGAIGVEGTCGGTRRSIFVGGGLVPTPVMASAVKVGDKYVSVVIGAIKKGGGDTAPFSPEKIRPNIRSNRTRSYSYTVSD